MSQINQALQAYCEAYEAWVNASVDELLPRQAVVEELGRNLLSAIRVEHRIVQANPWQQVQVCTDCNGTGWTDGGANPCITCGTDGGITTTATEKINQIILAGIGRAAA